MNIHTSINPIINNDYSDMDLKSIIEQNWLYKNGNIICWKISLKLADEYQKGDKYFHFIYKDHLGLYTLVFYYNDVKKILHRTRKFNKILKSSNIHYRHMKKLGFTD